jgi:hypothetical protein
MVPKTVPSCVCDQPHVESNAKDRANKQELYDTDFVLARTGATITAPTRLKLVMLFYA